MNDFLENLPSLGQMFKLIVFLILALIAVSLVVAIIKELAHVIILGLVLVVGYYFFNRWQENNA